uniref:Uncharacterized protein n=1 Tax=Rhizophora mucronata TaxID=61149 RepID=A0A2P2QY93_RHIMU
MSFPKWFESRTIYKNKGNVLCHSRPYLRFEIVYTF